MPIIPPSRDFEGSDFTWQNWELYVGRGDWSSAEAAHRTLNKALRQAAIQSIEKEKALSYLFAWLRKTDFGIEENSLRGMANQAYIYAEDQRTLQAAGQDSSSDGVKLEKFRRSVAKKNWTEAVRSNELRKSIRYSVMLNMSADACFDALAQLWVDLGVTFEPEELRALIQTIHATCGDG